MKPNRALVWTQHALPPIAVAIVFAAVAETVVRGGLIKDYLLPAPSTVFQCLYKASGDLATATLQTSEAALIGFGLSAAIGVGVAVLLSSSRWVQRAFYPWAVLFQTVPLIAVAPLLVIYFGNDMPAVVASATIVSIFPIIANTLAGLLSTDPSLRDLFKLYRAGTLATLLKLRLPFALPNIMTGLRIGAGLAVIGTIVGEFMITGSGLGGYIAVSRNLHRIDQIFAALLLSALLGIAIFLSINFISYLALRHWHASEKES